jgi:membrane-associated phospholipid phosphatase
MPQAVVVVLSLALIGRLKELRIFMLSFAIAALITIAISALVPAEGVWGYYRLHAAAYPDIVPATRELHLPVFHGLRDGTFRTLMATGAEGIITFPSLHAALALLLAVALWPVPVLRWIGVAINLVMLISIPVDGGHYFIDMLAGLAVAVVSLATVRTIAAQQHAPVPSAALRNPAAEQR